MDTRTKTPEAAPAEDQESTTLTVPSHTSHRQRSGSTGARISPTPSEGRKSPRPPHLIFDTKKRLSSSSETSPNPLPTVSIDDESPRVDILLGFKKPGR